MIVTALETSVEIPHSPAYPDMRGGFAQTPDGVLPGVALGSIRVRLMVNHYIVCLIKKEEEE